MLEDTGDLWTYPAEYRCVTTNSVIRAYGGLTMGAGTALQAKIRFPHLPKKLAAWVETYGNRPFLCKAEGLITFPTKHHWRDDSVVELIVESAGKIVQIVDKFNIGSVVTTRPGCGNGGLRWEDVRPHLAEVFDDRFTVLGKPLAQ